MDFAKTGNPNGPGLPDWPIYRVEKDRHLELGDKLEPKAGLWKDACDLMAKMRREKDEGAAEPALPLNP